MQNVLILEDIADAQRWLSIALNDAFEQVEITYASTLAQALVIIKKQQFDIALIDLKLPDGSGVDAIRQIKQMFPETLCIVVTIYDDDQYLFPALQAGAQGYLLKDLSTTKISQRLKGIAEGEPPLSPAIARRLLNHFGNVGSASEIKLTSREEEVLALIAKGMKLIEVADVLGITRHTAAGYVKEIYRKLNISSRAEATIEAMRRGLISPT
jgi:DNA-binding NarL/FixJ family response regulator